MGGKKCNEEIWYEKLQPRNRSKDFKVQKSESCVLKAIRTISNIANSSLDLKSNKSSCANDMRKALVPVIHICTGSIAILSNVNSGIEENRHENIINCLDSQYHRLTRNVPSDSRWLFGDDIRTRIMTLGIILKVNIITKIELDNSR